MTVLPLDLAGPLGVGAVQDGRVGVAAAARLAAGVGARRSGCRAGRGRARWRRARRRSGRGPPLAGACDTPSQGDPWSRHFLQYIYCMTGAGSGGGAATGGSRLHRRAGSRRRCRRRRRRSPGPSCAGRRRRGRDRAKNLLWAAGKLAAWAIGLGLDPVPQVLLHPSVIERFAAHAPGLSGAGPPHAAHQPAVHRPRGGAARWTRRTRRCPASEPRRRTRRRRSTATSRWPMPSPPRRGGCAPPALVCLGAGAGLIRSDLRARPRHRRHRPLRRRHRRQSAAARPRAVPVLARYHEPLLASAAFAGEHLLTGGTDPAGGNITNPLTRSLAGGSGLPPWTPAGCAPPGWPRPRS